jgi:hypothetical protein
MVQEVLVLTAAWEAAAAAAAKSSSVAHGGLVDATLPLERPFDDGRTTELQRRLKSHCMGNIYTRKQKMNLYLGRS